MVHSFAHIPVLRDEIVLSFATVPAGVVVDATVGGGGHSAALLTAYPGLQIIGLDRDPVALEAAAAETPSPEVAAAVADELPADAPASE